MNLGDAIQFLALPIAVGGGLWGLFTYNISQKTSRAMLINSLHQQFYSSPRVLQAERIVKYRQSDDFKTLLQNRVIRRDIPLTEANIDELMILDELLNFLDHIAFLQRSRLIRKEEEFSMLRYWRHLLELEENAALRQYTASLGFAHLSALVKLSASKFYSLDASLASVLGSLVLSEGRSLQYEAVTECKTSDLSRIDEALSATSPGHRRDLRKLGGADVWLFTAPAMVGRRRERTRKRESPDE